MTHVDGTSDYATGEFVVVNAQIVDQNAVPMTNRSGVTIQEVVTTTQTNPGGQPIHQNTRTTTTDANGIMPDSIGPGRNAPAPDPNAARDLNSFLSQPLNVGAVQELFVMAPGRGVTLYGVNDTKITNLDSQGKVGAVSITHTPRTVTSRVVGIHR